MATRASVVLLFSLLHSQTLIWTTAGVKCGSEPILGPGEESDGRAYSGQVNFPENWSVYQVKTAYNCTWTFVPSSADQRIGIRFTKFRTDQRCYMKDRSLRSIDTIFTCHVHSSYKYPLEAINRIVVSEVSSSGNTILNETTLPNEVMKNPGSSQPYASGCLCGTGESRYINSDTDDTWWFISGPPSPTSGALRVEFVVPRPHIGLMFKAEYKFIDGLSGCGSHTNPDNVGGSISFSGFPNTTEYGIACDWNMELSPKIEEYGGSFADWQLLLKFTNITTTNASDQDYPNHIKWPVKNQGQDEILLLNLENSSISDSNAKVISILPLLNSKARTVSNNSLNASPLSTFRFTKSSVLLRYISPPKYVHETDGPTSFQLRWSPFMKLVSNDQTEVCKKGAFVCTSNIKDNTTSAESSSYCLPPLLVCNGYPECPNSSDDEEPAMCRKLAEASSTPAHKLGPWPPYIAVVGMQSSGEGEHRGNQDDKSHLSLPSNDVSSAYNSSDGKSAANQSKVKNKTLLILLCIFLPLFLLALLTVCVIVVRRLTGRKSGYNVKYYNTTSYKLHRELDSTDHKHNNGKPAKRETLNGTNGIGKSSVASNRAVVDRLSLPLHTGSNGIKNESYIPLVGNDAKRENGHTAI